MWRGVAWHGIGVATHIATRLATLFHNLVCFGDNDINSITLIPFQSQSAKCVCVRVCGYGGSRAKTEEKKMAKEIHSKNMPVTKLNYTIISA